MSSIMTNELERITADPAGAAGMVGRRRRRGRGEAQTLGEALDNPDGDRLYAVQWEQARRLKAEREAAEREVRRPVCTNRGVKFTEDRWEAVRGWGASWGSDSDGLCRSCGDSASAWAEGERLVRR
ncbi:hypothetical protein [Streptomyces tritici]|uniref:hypothetical protein n=1 Tax=Streptomyces tritici TaxID=2054410 RepID=UPI003AEF6E99